MPSHHRTHRASGLLAGTALALLLTACSPGTEPAGEGAEDAAQQAAEAEVRQSDRSYYVEMEDGVRVALSLYYPGGREPEEPRPTILVQTRYGREGMIGTFERFVEAGYVLASVDTRGSTSSFGLRRVDIGPEEIADMDVLIGHIADQPWSDGNVFAQGTSYMADTADIATSRPAPALKGAIIRQVDFDVFLQLFFPGGVANEWFLQNWGGATKAADEGRSPRPGEDYDCLARAEDCAPLWPILAPVDGDDDYALLREALAGRERWAPDDYAGMEFHDDAGENGYVFFHSAPAHHLDGIRREATPAQVWGSWVDGGTAEAALARWRSAPDVPMEIWLTGNDHSNRVLADPYLPGVTEPRPAADDQFAVMDGFYETIMSEGYDDRRIHYYVMGAGVYRTTGVWPPEGVAPETFFLADDNTLSPARPTQAGVDVYEVDFTAQTGAETRWSTQFGTPPAYPDRRGEDEKLIVFDTAPFEADMEVAGTPVIELHVATATDDPAFHVYLEDVAPDGRVTYLTEGQFRAIHRAPADTQTLPYDMGSAPHSYRREDALPVVPGERMAVEFALFPVAARIEAGHRLRVAIAGADASYFRRYSNGEDEVFEIARGGEAASRISVPMRPWQDG
jgi:hypothetical protein